MCRNNACSILTLAMTFLLIHCCFCIALAFQTTTNFHRGVVVVSYKRDCTDTLHYHNNHPRSSPLSTKVSGQTQEAQSDIHPAIIYPDYLITDSEDLPDSDRPNLLKALLNPRDILGSSVVAIGAIVSLFNIIGAYDDTYLTLEVFAISFGFLSSVAHFLQIKTGYLISPNLRLGIVDDAAVNLYAGLYTAAVSWLALRTSQICPDLLKVGLVDKGLASISIMIFIYSLVAPIITLAADTNNYEGIPYKLSQKIVEGARGSKENQLDEKEVLGLDNDSSLPPLSKTELLRARGLLFIGILGCIFTPDALSFFLGGQDWWGRVSNMHPSQQTLESSTSLFAIFATESSMIAHRVGKLGVAKYSIIVPVFAGVCFVLAVVPCVCALGWLGGDVSFFSFYRE